MTSVVQQLAENVGGSGRRTREANRGVTESYRETFLVLLQFCQVFTMKEAAPIRACLANGSKGEYQSVNQKELTQQVCVGRGLTPDLYYPVVIQASSRCWSPVST
jgi:hypothetical protein